MKALWIFSSYVCLILVLASVVGSWSRNAPNNAIANATDTPDDSDQDSADYTDLIPENKKDDDFDYKIQLLDGTLPADYAGHLTADKDGYSAVLGPDALSEYFVMNNGSVKFSVELADPGKLHMYSEPSVLQFDIPSVNSTLKFCFYKGKKLSVEYCVTDDWKQLVDTHLQTSLFNFLINRNGAVDITAENDKETDTMSVTPWIGQKLGNESIAVQFQMTVMKNTTKFNVKFEKGAVATLVKVPKVRTGSVGSHQWLSDNKVYLIVGGCILVVVIIGLIIIICCCRCRKKKEDAQQEGGGKLEGGAADGGTLGTTVVTETQETGATKTTVEEGQAAAAPGAPQQAAAVPAAPAATPAPPAGLSSTPTPDAPPAAAPGRGRWRTKRVVPLQPRQKKSLSRRMKRNKVYRGDEDESPPRTASASNSARSKKHDRAIKEKH